MAEMHTLTVVSDEKPRTLRATSDGHPNLASVQVIGVLDHFDEPVKRLNVELLSAYLRAFENLAEYPGSRAEASPAASAPRAKSPVNGS